MPGRDIHGWSMRNVHNADVFNLPLQTTQNGNHHDGEEEPQEQENRQQRQHPNCCDNSEESTRHQPDPTGSATTRQLLDHDQD